VFGASFLLAPSPILRIWWPDDGASGPIALGLARGLGARDAALGLGILAAVLRRESSRGWLLAAAGADAADLVLTLTNAYPFGRRTRILSLAGIALYVMLQLYLAFDQEELEASSACNGQRPQAPVATAPRQVGRRRWRLRHLRRAAGDGDASPVRLSASPAPLCVAFLAGTVAVNPATAHAVRAPLTPIHLPS
jgi:hypothetical protein